MTVGGVCAVTEIFNDAWLGNVSPSGGAGGISIAITSDFITSRNNASGLSGLLIQTGKNSFVERTNTTDPDGNNLYIGDGDYSTLINSTFTNLTITPDAEGTYQIEYAKFGYANTTALTNGSGYIPTEGYFANIGYTNQSQSAVFALDFVGLGLPDYLWHQVVNMMR